MQFATAVPAGSVAYQTPPNGPLSSSGCVDRVFTFSSIVGKSFLMTASSRARANQCDEKGTNRLSLSPP